MGAMYSVGIWDRDKQSYVPHRGLSVPPYNITVHQLRQAIRDLRGFGYSCHRRRSVEGDYDDNDWTVLIERTDGESVLTIRRGWKR